MRTHRFTYQDCGAVNAVFDESEASQLTVEASVFKKLLEQVDHSNQICITASRDSFRISSFHQDILVGNLKRHMSTEMSMATNEFLGYKYYSRNECEELVLQVKELKSMLWLCEANEIAEFSLFFSTGGK